VLGMYADAAETVAKALKIDVTAKLLFLSGSINFAMDVSHHTVVPLSRLSHKFSDNSATLNRCQMSHKHIMDITGQP
jgi:hypothetical protein